VNTHPFRALMRGTSVVSPPSPLPAKQSRRGMPSLTVLPLLLAVLGIAGCGGASLDIKPDADIAPNHHAPIGEQLGLVQ
jgi:hypothetical protein